MDFARFTPRRDRLGRRFVRLRFDTLEDRTVPAAALKAFDDQTIAVGFRTGDAGDPVVPHAVALAPGQTVDDALAQGFVVLHKPFDLAALEQGLRRARGAAAKARHRAMG